MSLSLNSSVTLIIKAPNQKIADQKIECTVDWTVRKLKQHLAKVYPTNPTEAQQRIIYSGKLLFDDHQLQDVLKQYEPDQNVHTVHLVCMASMSDSQVPSSAALQNVAEGVLSAEGLRRRQPPIEATSPSPSSSSSSLDPESNTSSRALPLINGQSFVPTMDNYQSYVPTVNYQSYAQHPGAMYYGAVPPPMVPSFAPGFAPYGAEQLQWMQQAYAQSMMHYMQQFQQQQQATTVQPHLVGHAPPVMPAIPVPLANQNFPNELQGAGAMADPDAPLQPMRLNAQGGHEADDEDGGERANRDWLDKTYILVRFLMLMSILYFYSTPQRFLSMLTLVLFAYLGRAGWLRGRRADRNVAQQREQPTPPPPPPQQDAHHETPQTPEDPEQEMNMVDLQATHRPSTFEVIWSVITSFFASLIPENPPPININ